MRTRLLTLSCALGLLGFGCAADATGEGSGALAPHLVEECSVLAFGTLENGDPFEGDATNAGGITSGTWEHGVPGEDPCADDDEDDDGGWGRHGRRGHGHHRWGHHHARRRGHDRHRGRGHDEHRGRGRGHDRGGCGCDEEPTEGNHLVGEVEAMTCIFNGVRTAAIEGSGTWNGEAGYTFEAAIVDSGTGDSYDITVIAPDGTVVYTAGGNPDSGEAEAVEL